MSVQWVLGPSRSNDTAFTRLALADAIRACGRYELGTAIPVVGFALDAIGALHPGSRSWPEHADAEAAWIVLRSSAVWEPRQERTFAALTLTAQRLRRLAVRLTQADADERTLIEYEAAMVEEGT